MALGASQTRAIRGRWRAVGAWWVGDLCSVRPPGAWEHEKIVFDLQRPTNERMSGGRVAVDVGLSPVCECIVVFAAVVVQPIGPVFDV